MTPDPEPERKVGFQHDADPAADDRTVDDRPLEEIMADAMISEEYVLSSQEAMDSAVEQQATIDAGGAQ